MGKKTALEPRSYTTELVVFGTAVASFLLLPSTSAIVWIMPVGIIAVYLLHFLFTAGINKKFKKQVQTVENGLSWKQDGIRLIIGAVMYITTTGFFRGNVSGYSELFSIIMAVVCILLVPMAMKNFFVEYNKGFNDGAKDLFARSNTFLYRKGYVKGLSEKSKSKMKP